MRAADVTDFAAEPTGELMAYPTYYARMAPINRAGAPVLGRLPEPPGMSPTQVEEAQRRGVWVVNGRDRDAFAAGHLPGSSSRWCSTYGRSWSGAGVSCPAAV